MTCIHTYRVLLWEVGVGSFEIPGVSQIEKVGHHHHQASLYYCIYSEYSSCERE